MRTNPGGNLAPDEVIGRDQLVARLWRVLQRQSAVLTAERRMGKTCIIQKMEKQPPAGIETRYRDLEQVASAFEFSRLVLEDVERLLPVSQRASLKARQLFERLSGAKGEAAGVKLELPGLQAPPWQQLLNQTLADLAEQQQKQQKTLVFFWDEVPWMLDKILQREGAATAMQLLDSLRAARQTHPRLRMVLTGSIGLHHVEEKLRAEGYRNKPFNDVFRLDVPQLDEAAAIDLAKRLFEGEGLTPANPDATAQVLAQAVDGVAFYIQHVVSEMAFRQMSTPSEVHTIVTEALCDSQDRWDLHHFSQRIASYYPNQDDLARGVLDIIAVADALDFTAIVNRLRANATTAHVGDEEARTILTLLQRDHYLQKDTAGVYAFRFSLIRRWWRLHRGLSS